MAATATATYQEEQERKDDGENTVLNIGIRCCISAQTGGETLDSLHELQSDTNQKGSPSPRQRRLRGPLSKRMPSALRLSSKQLMASFTSLTEDAEMILNTPSSPVGVTATQAAQLVANEFFGGMGPGPELFNIPSQNPAHHHPLQSSVAGGTMAHAAQLAASEYFLDRKGPALMDDVSSQGQTRSDVDFDPSMASSRFSDCESRDVVMMPETSKEENALALEVGHSAYEYLEECFYTEVSVLDREKFNDIPEIVKSDFIVKGHLGKGCFSDVFEVVRKGGHHLSAAKKAISDDADVQPNSRRRRSFARGQRRSTLASSITTATLARPSYCRERQTLYALKCLRPQIRCDAEQFTIGAEDLVHETAMLANLDHKNIIKLYGRAAGDLTDAFVLNDGYFILLDRLDETLHQRIDTWKSRSGVRSGSPAVTVAQIEVARSVADAVAYLHSKKIVFRDLKPDNVGFDANGVLKLFDFGFAIGLPERDEENPAGFLFDKCGTPRYMAPEVALSLGYGLKADMYSFGMLLWEICALIKPFDYMKSHCQFQEAVFMGGERPEIEEQNWPVAIKEIIRECWSADPSQRPRRWGDVKSSLESAVDDKSSGDKKKKIPAAMVGSRLVRSMMTRATSSPDPAF